MKLMWYTSATWQPAKLYCQNSSELIPREKKRIWLCQDILIAPRVVLRALVFFNDLIDSQLLELVKALKYIVVTQSRAEVEISIARDKSETLNETSAFCLRRML